jgi:hypothetical protein
LSTFFEVFPRGRDRTPRSEVAGLYRALLLDDGPIAEELLSYSPTAVANLPFRLQLGRAQ